MVHRYASEARIPTWLAAGTRVAPDVALTDSIPGPLRASCAPVHPREEHT